MNWIEVAWTMIGSASLMLAVIHLFVWFKQRSKPAHLWFFGLAVGVSALGVLELMAMEASTPGDYAIAGRWVQVPLFGVVACLVAFVHAYFGTGRTWLAYTTVATRGLALVLNFTTAGVSVLHQDVTGLAHVALLGGAVISTPIAVLSPWAVVPQISNVLLVAFVADASLALWRRGDPLARRRAALVGGAFIVLIGAATVSSFLITAGWLRAPTLVTPLFFLVILSMGYELGWDVLHAAQLSQDLRESERRMELAGQAAELAFWSWNSLRDDMWISAKGHALFELDPSPGIRFDDLMLRVHPDDRQGLQESIKRALESSSTFEREVRLALPSGQPRWIAVRGQVERRGDTQVVVRGVALDITARSRLEREAAQQRGELAHLSRVATLGELSGSLAHEINQPLMGILSNAQAAQRFMAGDNVNLDEVREILADIVEDDKRAGEVIRRLRALLRKGEVQRGVLDVNNVVDDVLRLTRNDLMNRDVTLNTELSPQLPPILGDRIQLQQVLLNLVMNACDAMETSGTREVSIRTRCVDSQGIEVSVSDRGIGVLPADLERIFEPFVTTKEHGTGLGLSVCRTIVVAHGGRLWAENNTDRGATFRFTLPIVVGAK